MLHMHKFTDMPIEATCMNLPVIICYLHLFMLQGSFVFVFVFRIRRLWFVEYQKSRGMDIQIRLDWQCRVESRE
jgi:hypothetical protein